MQEEEEEKKKKEEEGESFSGKKIGWNPVQTEATRTSGKSTTETTIAGDTSEWDKPAGFDFKAPEKPKFKYDPEAGILSAFRPEEPKPDIEGAEREKKLARVNAFGDFMKNLGAFAGTGYAPVEKRQENKSVLRAFARLDEIRNLYDAKKEKYDDKMFAIKSQDYAGQKTDAEQEYGRRYNEELARANRDYQIAENIRQGKQTAYWENGTKRTTTQSGESAQYKNLDLLNAELEAKRARGSGKGPFMRVQFKNSDRVLDAEEWQARQAVTILKELYSETLNKYAQGVTLDDKERRITNDIAMLDAAMSNGNNSSAIKDLLASYVEQHWEDMQFVWKNVNAVPQIRGGGKKSTPENGGKTDVSGLFKK